MKQSVISLVLAFVAFGAVAEAQMPAKPNMFRTLAACNAALDTGNFRFYEPRYHGLRSQNPTNGDDRVVVPLETNLCLEMRVVGGRQFVAQREGTLFRAQKLSDGSLSLYAREDCGNPVYGVVFPAPVRRIHIDLEPEIVPEVILPHPVTPRSDRYRRDDRTVVPARDSGGCGKKCKWIIAGLAGGAIAGGVAYYYWPCPPGTVRK